MKNRSWIRRWSVVWLLILALPLVPWTTQHLHSQRAHAQLGGGYRLSSLVYLSKVVFLVNKHYVDRRQIQPAKMFRKALERVQMLVPAVMVRFDKGKSTVEVRVDQKKKSFRVRPFPMLFSVPFQLRPIFSFIEKNYKGDVELRKIEFAALHGILSTLDRHSNFLPPSFYKDMQLHTDGQFGGLGIVIQNKDGYLTVMTPMPGTPASRVGVKPLDRIVRIGDESTINMSLNEAVTKLRGKPGSKVVIWIQRKGFTRPKRFVIIRALIRVKSVTSNLLPKKIGYIRVKHFQKDTTRDIRKALKEFHRKSKGIKGLILDLRNNPGGLLDQAISVSDLFLRKGTIVTHQGGASRREEHNATSLGTEPNYPIVVLVNRGSASASEIVSGALKNHNRALILGQQTHGKGTVQVLFPIYPPRYFSRERSALKLTVAQYLTPGDISIQEIGITPDIALNAVHISKDLVHFFNSEGKRKLKKGGIRFLRGVREKRKPLYHLSYFDARSDKERASQYREEYVKTKFKPDFEVSLASKLLLKSDSWQRLRFLAATKKLLNSIRNKEGKRIAKALKKAGVIWQRGPRKGASVPKLQISAKLLPIKPQKGKKKGEAMRPPRGKRVWAGSGFRLQVTVRNRGKSTAYRVRAMTHSDDWFFNRKEFVFGKLRPGQSKRWTSSFLIPKWVKPQVKRLRVTATSSFKGFKKNKDIFLRVQGFKRPHFDFSYAIEEIKGNGDSLVQPGESFALRVTVRNQGPGKSFPIIGLLKNKTGRELFIKTGRIRFGKLAKGQHATGWFYFSVKSYVTPRKMLEMDMSIFDTELHTTARRKLSLRVYPLQLKRRPLRNQRISIKEKMAWVYGGAAFDAPRIARLPKGSQLAVTGRLGAFLQIQLPRSLWGSISKKTPKKHKPLWRAWVPARDVKFLTSKSPKRAPKVRFYYQSVTPRIEVKNARKALITNKATFTLQGNIRNNVSLLDAYILVNGEKVFYRALRNVPKLSFKFPIKLKKGLNRVFVVARESVQFSGYKELFIYYQPKRRRISKR